MEVSSDFDIDKIVRQITFKRAWQGCSPEDKEDMRGAAYLAAIEAERSWPGTGNKGGWIYTAVDRGVIDHNRQFGPRTKNGILRADLYASHSFDREVYPGSGLTFADVLSDPDAPSVDAEIVGKSEIAHVHYLAQFLSEREQEMVDLYFLKGWTQDDIGALYDVQKARVSQIIKGALQNLRTYAETGPPKVVRKPESVVDSISEPVVVEQWKKIKGFGGMYEISDFGRIRSLDRMTKFKNRRGEMSMRFMAGHILSIPPNDRGYYPVRLAKNKGSKADRKRASFVHILVAETFIGAAPGPIGRGTNEWCVTHLDGDLTNNVPLNLAWKQRTKGDKEAMRRARRALKRQEVRT